MKNTCGYCLFKTPIEPESTDIIWCWKLKKRKDIMDPGCAAFIFETMTQVPIPGEEEK